MDLTLPPGEDVLLGTVLLEVSSAANAEVDLNFVDGMLSFTPGGLPMENTVIVDGFAVGLDEGLTLTAGGFCAL